MFDCLLEVQDSSMKLQKVLDVIWNDGNRFHLLQFLI